MKLHMLVVLSVIISCCKKSDKVPLTIKKNAHIVLIGNNLCSRMMNFGYFETELHARYPNSTLFIRNMCDGGNTPVFRPHSSRNSPWAFPGAEQYESELLVKSSGSIGHFPTEDEWLTSLKADIILAFFGYSESFQGPAGLENFKQGLKAFIDHTKQQRYNGTSVPQLALVSPIAFEDLSSEKDLPDGERENQNLALYTQAMQEVAEDNGVLFLNAFQISKDWYKSEVKRLTADGFQLNSFGYRKFAGFLADRLFGSSNNLVTGHYNRLRSVVLDKNWLWHNDFKIPNGVHAYGRRYNPFGPANYPFEIQKIRQMTANRDTAIWNASRGESYNLKKADTRTSILPPVKSNFEDFLQEGKGKPGYLYGQKALDQIITAKGYKMELFASEKEFPNLANPSQLSFDNQGRLWVGVMPSYPHYKPGDGKPNDKLLILEDTDKDGKADKETVFADSLHLTIGFELAPEGVFVSQGTNLILLRDTDGDDRADEKEIILSGFDDHDTHHAISAFTADPSGAIFMGEGVFLHSNIETAYGTVRATNGGFYRYNPQRHHLERTAQLSIPNPWGIAFDSWGQNFFIHTSNPYMTWMTPGTIKPRYGEFSPLPVENIIQEEHLVRPTSGLEFISSRHFPPEIQGDFIVNNTIGFLGAKVHSLIDDPNSAGYLSEHRMDLMTSTDPNFRPVDMEYAPDGSLYFVDWHNILIGHMQHNARDPLRDHVHGRIYRMTYPARPLVKPAKIAGASIEELLDNLKLPEYRTRYRTRRELRGRNPSEVLSKLKEWVATLDPTSQDYEHHVLEALWVTWGLNRIDPAILNTILTAEDFRARAAGVKVLRYAGHQIPNQAELLMNAAKDVNAKVRLEALVAATWLKPDIGLAIVEATSRLHLDRWMREPYRAGLAHLKGQRFEKIVEQLESETEIKGAAKELYEAGKKIYHREGFCVTCHQADGLGLQASDYPPLANTSWVTGNKERLIKLTLKGLMGPIEVAGKVYPGTVPMTPFGGMLTDDEIASVLTYVRNSFGNKSEPISAENVKNIRNSIKDKESFYSAQELLKSHPLEN